MAQGVQASYLALTIQEISHPAFHPAATLHRAMNSMNPAAVISEHSLRGVMSLLCRFTLQAKMGISPVWGEHG